jgi:hypothetical protein
MKTKWSNMTAIIWKDKGDMHMLTHIHNPLAEGNYFDYSEICTEAKHCGGLQFPHGLS